MCCEISLTFVMMTSPAWLKDPQGSHAWMISVNLLRGILPTKVCKEIGKTSCTVDIIYMHGSDNQNFIWYKIIGGLEITNTDIQDDYWMYAFGRHFYSKQNTLQLSYNSCIWESNPWPQCCYSVTYELQDNHILLYILYFACSIGINNMQKY